MSVMIIKIYSILPMAFLVIGCQSYTENPVEHVVGEHNKHSCEYMERNLTVQWEKRRYYCLPINYRGKLKVFKHESSSK